MAEIEAKIEFNNKILKKLVEAMSKQYSVKVGLLANKTGENGSKGTDVVSENLDLAGLGAVHEFGANIEHPGGTPYFINEWGMATFVKKDSFYGQLLIKRGQVTKPHTINIPARPWLSMPLTRNNGKDLQNKVLNTAKNKDKVSGDELMEYTIQTGDFYTLAEIIGASALEQIQEAFDTQGFGEWTPNAPATIAKKGSADPLIDKGRLRGAITYEVTENE